MSLTDLIGIKGTSVAEISRVRSFGPPDSGNSILHLAAC